MQELPTITLSFWPIVFLIAGGQSLFFSFIVFSNKPTQKSNLYLGAFLLFFGYMLFFNFCCWTNYLYHFPHGFYTNLLLNYLFGPLLLLYLDSLREQPKLQKWWWVHFIPVIVYFLYLSPFYFQTAATKTQNVLGQTPYPDSSNFKWLGLLGTFKVFGLHLFIYFLWKIKLYFQLIHPSENNHFAQETKIIRKNWLRLLLVLYAAFLFSYLSYFLIADQPFFLLMHDYIISAIMTISIYIIGYLGYKRPQIFSGDLLKKVFINEKKYATSSLTDSAILSIKNTLQTVIISQKPYRNNDLKMKDLAAQLQIAPHHLSQVINENFGKSFNQYINEWRIKEAIELLKKPANQKTFLIQIAYQVGFNNKTTFNAAFKKIVGCSPSQFRKQILEKKDFSTTQNGKKGQIL